MNLKEAIAELVELSHYAAKHPLFIQGGGGNCSVKYDTKMVIKASGLFLEEVSFNKGYVQLDLDTGKQVGDLNLRPSLETPLHLLLGNYVIHTHPIVVGALVCSVEGKRSYKEVLSERNCYWVDYATPGIQLSSKVDEVIKSHSIDMNENLVLLLENHGIFVSSNSQEGCIELHEKCIKELNSFLCVLEVDPLACNLNGFLTPDHVVYSELDKIEKISRKQELAKEELKAFAKSVAAIIRNKKWRIKYISNKDVEFIRNMEEEKYRQGLLGWEK